MTKTDQDKSVVRERIWELLEQEHAVPEPGVHGHIPNFHGAAAAAERLAELPSWKTAQVVKAVPDQAQYPVRAMALAAGKLLYMAVPRLADPLPFYLLDPETLPSSPAEAATARGAADVAHQVGVDEMRPVDVVVCGSVAVNREGVRLGKGAGYSDIEVALLCEAGLVTDETTIVTTVHHLQVVDESLPEAEHDFRVDLIVTPDEVISCGPPRRPPGLLWASLTSEKIASIPLLASRAAT
ncbi:5-formyltetrahydrofolate cyclo-ligase [Actinomadura roseirufa]|uniref:5-formyltetrahydrofolate cyclo-ligase n=1 Tax=Actinomadura roseirufa TaxID=2094049 RepID=UPI0010418C65|nr:5-formyltetrahydrofolate cyclo-ligase [Actinomadura roseirufa]